MELPWKLNGFISVQCLEQCLAPLSEIKVVIINVGVTVTIIHMICMPSVCFSWSQIKMPSHGSGWVLPACLLPLDCPQFSDRHKAVWSCYLCVPVPESSRHLPGTALGLENMHIKKIWSSPSAGSQSSKDNPWDTDPHKNHTRVPSIHATVFHLISLNTLNERKPEQHTFHTRLEGCCYLWGTSSFIHTLKVCHGSWLSPPFFFFFQEVFVVFADLVVFHLQAKGLTHWFQSLLHRSF